MRYYGNHRGAEWIPNRASLPRPLPFSLRHQIPFPQACLSSISNQPETLPVTKSPSSSMKSSIIFLLKFNWKFFQRSYNILCVLNSALWILGAPRWSKRIHAGKEFDDVGWQKWRGNDTKIWIHTAVRWFS